MCKMLANEMKKKVFDLEHTEWPLSLRWANKDLLYGAGGRGVGGSGQCPFRQAR